MNCGTNYCNLDYLSTWEAVRMCWLGRKEKKGRLLLSLTDACLLGQLRAMGRFQSESRPHPDLGGDPSQSSLTKLDRDEIEVDGRS